MPAPDTMVPVIQHLNAQLKEELPRALVHLHSEFVVFLTSLAGAARPRTTATLSSPSIQQAQTKTLAPIQFVGKIQISANFGR